LLLIIAKFAKISSGLPSTETSLLSEQNPYASSIISHSSFVNSTKPG